LYQRSKLKQTALVALSEDGLDLRRAGLETDQGLEDLRDHADRLAVGDECAVDHNRVGCARKDEGPSFSGSLVVVAPAACRDESERQRGEQQEHQF
jgi:hypothetical protein